MTDCPKRGAIQHRLCTVPTASSSVFPRGTKFRLPHRPAPGMPQGSPVHQMLPPRRGRQPQCAHTGRHAARQVPHECASSSFGLVVALVWSPRVSGRFSRPFLAPGSRQSSLPWPARPQDPASTAVVTPTYPPIPGLDPSRPRQPLLSVMEHAANVQ